MSKAVLRYLDTFLKILKKAGAFLGRKTASLLIGSQQGIFSPMIFPAGKTLIYFGDVPASHVYRRVKPHGFFSHSFFITINDSPVLTLISPWNPIKFNQFSCVSPFNPFQQLVKPVWSGHNTGDPATNSTCAK